MTTGDGKELGSVDAALGYPAWRGFISWAYGNENMRAAYAAETGILWPPDPRNGLERMIDDATVSDRLKRFVIWASERWGEQHCPIQIRQEIASRKTVRAELDQQDQEGRG